MHGLILGSTESGKTTLACMLAEQLHGAGYGVLVLDGLSDFPDPRWKASYIAGSRAVNRFMSVVRRSRSCYIFVDETRMMCRDYPEEMVFLATKSRHWGHSVFFINQRGVGIDKTIRDQASALYLFTTSITDSKMLADEFNKPEIAQGNTLAQGEYFYCTRFSPAERRRLF